MAVLNTLRVSRPALTDELAHFFMQNLYSKISIEELVGMVIFIEWFSANEDRDILRATYFTNLAERFNQHDLGRKDWEDVMMHASHNAPGLDIKPHMLNRHKAIFVKETIYSDIDPTIKAKQLVIESDFQRLHGGMATLMKYQRDHQNIFLEITEYIEKVYIAIHQFYANSAHNGVLQQLVGSCYGGIPKISSATCTHIDIQVVVGEVY